MRSHFFTTAINLLAFPCAFTCSLIYFTTIPRYISHTQSVKQNTQLSQPSGRRLATIQPFIQLNHLSHFSLSSTALCCHLHLLQYPDAASTVSHVDEQEGRRVVRRVGGVDAAQDLAGHDLTAYRVAERSKERA